MGECISNIFICDGNLKDKEEFCEELLFSGITLYEVIRVIEGVPLFLENHLKRLKNSAEITKVQLKYDTDEIKRQLNLLINASKIYEGNIKLIFNYNVEDTFCAYFIKHAYPSKELYLSGVDTILYHGERNNPNAKVINNVFRKNVDERIKETEAYEAILIDRNGNVTEGSKSNIFMIKDDKVYTAPIKDVLPGVTRDIIIQACNNIHIDIMEKRVNYEEIKELDALFISGTSPKVLPIRSVDKVNFKSSENKILLSIMTAYDEIIKKYIETNRNIKF